MRTLPIFCVLLLLVASARAGPETTHTGSHRAKRVEVRFRPGSRAAADADRQAVAVERDLDRIGSALGKESEGPFVLWLFDDIWELWASTGVENVGGFSAGNASYVPYDNDQTRLHEICHVVTHQWKRSGDEARNMFFPDGIANAVLEFVHGVHVHAVAAHYRRTGRLPTLAEMIGAEDFYAWMRARPGFNAYDVAGSFLRYLLDEYGASKLRRFYTGASARSAFGADLAKLEKAWHAMLDGYVLRAEVETLLRQRDGEPVSFRASAEGVPAPVLGRPEDWSSILEASLQPDAASRWQRKGPVLAAANEVDLWSYCHLGEERYGDCVVRVRVRTTGYTPVQVRFGADNQVLLVQPGTFLFRGDAAVASDGTFRLPTESTTKDIVVARTGRKIEVWIDGRRALATDAGTEGVQPIGVGIHKGAAEFLEIRVRPMAPR